MEILDYLNELDERQKIIQSQHSPQPSELIGHLEDGTPVRQAKQESAKGASGNLNIEEDADTMNAVIEKRVAPVQGLIVEGLTLLCGNPKAGKPLLTMQMCCAVAYGVPFLGRTIIIHALCASAFICI